MFETEHDAVKRWCTTHYTNTELLHSDNIDNAEAIANMSHDMDIGPALI